MEHADEIIPILKSSLPFWEHLKETEKKTLSQWSQLVRYEKGGLSGAKTVNVPAC